MALSETDKKIIGELKRVTLLSHDPDRAVAAIIVDQDGEIISTGTNLPPEVFGYSIQDTHDAIRKDALWKYFMMEHAERNAILEALKANRDLHGATIYGSLFPCADCARAIVAAGIKRLVVPAAGLHPARDIKWQDHYKYAHLIFELAGVEISTFSSEEPSSV